MPGGEARGEEARREEGHGEGDEESKDIVTPVRAPHSPPNYHHITTRLPPKRHQPPNRHQFATRSPPIKKKIKDPVIKVLVIKVLVIGTTKVFSPFCLLTVLF